jgi:hypothetical protein
VSFPADDAMFIRRAAGVLAGILALTGMVLRAGAALPKEPAAPKDAPPQKADVNVLSVEVAALLRLNQLQATPTQMEALVKLARDVSRKEVKRTPAKVSDKYRQALLDLRDALVRGEDDDRIDELNDALDDLKESEKPDLDDAVETCADGRRLAPEALRLFTARQAASYLALYGDGLPDPAANLRGALEKAPGAAEDDWKELRDDTAEEVGWLVAGLDTARARRVSEKVGTLLDRAHKLKPEEFKEQRADLEKAAREVLDDVGPVEVLRHVLERDLAELLSNPRLPAALEARLKSK